MVQPIAPSARRGNVLALLAVVVVLVGAVLFLILAPEGEGASTARIADPTTEVEETGVGEDVDLTSDGSTEQDGRRAAAVDAGSGAVAVADEATRTGRRSTVTGRVTDAAGLPVVGAEVSLERLGPGSGVFTLVAGDGAPGIARSSDTAETDARGEFALETSAAGERVLVVERSGFVRHEVEPVQLLRGDTTDVGTLIMDAAAILMGRVVDPAGRGIADVELFEIPEQDLGGMVIALDMPFGGSPIATTGPAGEFSIDTIAPGAWKLQARHPDHPSRTFDGETERGGDVVRDLVLELPYGAQIAGFVSGTDRRPGPFRVVARSGSGFALMANPASSEVADDGSFLITGLEDGESYELQVVRGATDGNGIGNVISFGGMQEALSDTVRVPAGTLDAQLDILLPGRVRVQVVTGEPPVPLETFTASIGESWNMEAKRGEDGSVQQRHENGVVEFDDVSAVDDAAPWGREPKAVRIEADGYLQLEIPIRALPAPGELLDLGTHVLEPAAGARITVVADGAPVKGARVRLGRATDRGFELGDFGVARTVTIDASEGGGPDVETVSGGGDNRARTDDDGVAQLDLPASSGSFRLTVEHRDWASYSATVDVPPGETLDHVVELGPGGLVTVRVLDEQGRPVEGVNVAHRGIGGGGSGFAAFAGGGGSKTAADGTAVFERLAPGTHRFRTEPDRGGGALSFVVFDQDGDDRDWTEVVVEHGTSTEIVLTEAATASIAGQVRQDGEPLAGAQVRLRSSADGATSETGLAGLDMFTLGGGPSATTDEQGRYVIDAVEAGPYELVVSHPERALPATFDADVIAGVENGYDVDLFRNGIRGVVRSTDGEPLEGIVVRARRAGEDDAARRGIMAFTSNVGGGALSMLGGGVSQEVRTDAEGRYELVGLPEDAEIQVVAEASSEEPFTFAVETDPLRVGPGEWVEGVDIVAPPAGALRIVVSEDLQSELFFVVAIAQRLDDAGVPIEGESQTGFGEDGVVDMTGLEPGRYRVRLQGAGPQDGAPPRERDIEVTEGERTEVTFE